MNYSFRLALFWHAIYNVDTVFSRDLFDLPSAGTRDWLGEVVDFVAHGITCEMEFGEDQ